MSRHLYYGDRVNWVAVTAVGTVLADLALPLALIQLGALRQDRLRAQVSKVGAWIGTVEQMDEKTGSWTIPVLIRNGSELPVRVDSVDVAVPSVCYPCPGSSLSPLSVPLRRLPGGPWLLRFRAAGTAILGGVDVLGTVINCGPRAPGVTLAPHPDRRSCQRWPGPALEAIRIV